jgi:nitroreductase/dihydropteridine reductase
VSENPAKGRGIVCQVRKNQKPDPLRFGWRAAKRGYRRAVAAYRGFPVLLEKLNWRYATKKMDPAKAVSEDKVERIVEAARLAPTSSGLQPFEVYVVTNTEVREKIKAIAWNQAQVTDGSHLLVFAAWDNYTADRINHMFDLVNEVRGIRNEGWENYRQMLLASYPQRDAQLNYEHAARQAYIAVGLSLAQAAFEEVDATPMEGFDPASLDEILGLRERGLRSVVIIPLGYRQPEGDWLVNLKKVRRPLDQFVTDVK